MLVEDQRFLHEDLERLEQGIADRMGEEPKHVSLLGCAAVKEYLQKRDADWT